MYDGYAVGDDEEEDEEEGLPWSRLPQQQESDVNPWRAAAGLQREEEQEHEAEEIAALPQMPAEFYNGVDQLLRMSPPRLKSKKRFDVEDASSIVGGNARSHPSAAPPSAPTRKSVIPAPAQRGAVGKRHIDPNLLNEAFAYTDKLLREAALEQKQEEAEEALAARRNEARVNKPSSAGGVLERSLNAYGGGGGRSAKSAPLPSGKKGSSSSSAKERLGAGLVKRLRSTATGTGGGVEKSASARALLAGAASGNTFTVTAVSEDDSSGRKAMDFDALVANFTQGLTLRKLQAELAASQESMRRSQAAFKSLAAGSRG